MISSRPPLLAALAALLLVSIGTATAAEPPSAPEILARAGDADGLHSYAVPVHFDVHLRRPVGARGAVDGTIYFAAPSEAALVISRAPGVIGRFFKGTYHLDLAPQTWPQKYRATSIDGASAGEAYVVRAVPKNDPTVDTVTFTVARATSAPTGVSWHYRDGSTISVTIVSQLQGRAFLPQSETVSVSMSAYALDAECTYGTYALNAAVPPGTFGGTTAYLAR